MRKRIFSALSWPGRKLVALERTGRVVWSLVGVDAGGLAMWLFTLNGFVFHRKLGPSGWALIVGVPLLCYAVTLQYGLRPGRPWWQWAGKAVLGQALAAVILHLVFRDPGAALGSRQAMKFALSYLPWLLVSRIGYLGARRLLPRAPLECLRLTAVAGAGFFLFGGRFITSGAVGAGDAYWYCIMLADFVKQWRAGVFPVFVGQSEYAFNGAVSPLRLAPGLQHAAGIVDLFTGQSLPFFTLQNLTLMLAALAGIFSAYFCAAAILPGRRWTALGLAMLYLACPGILALGYQGDLLMSMMTLPFVPLAAYGIWRTLQADDRTSIAWTVLPLAAAWYCHPPIALWLTFAAALAHLAIGCRRWRDPRLYAWWGGGLALFLLATGYLFVSVATLGLPQVSSNLGLILYNIGSAFPAMFQPVSANASSLGNFQLGWSLEALLLFAAICCLVRPRRSPGLLVLAALILLFLLLPIPRVNAVVWGALPKTVRDITFLWPMQRFYTILAGLVIVAAAGAWARLNPQRLLWKASGFVILCGGLAWSGREALAFVLHDYYLRGPAPVPVPEPLLAPSNIILTRYAFSSFAYVPPYFTHGYIDPYLENQILTPDRQRVLASNAAAAEPSATARQIPLVDGYDGVQVVVLSPAFTLVPGVRYAARFAPSIPLGPGTLLLEGKVALRLYYMPDSAMGMIHHVPGNAFGFLPGSRDFFSLWTSQAEPEAVHIRYIFNQVPTAAVPRNFARLYLQPYAIDHLPVNVTSWTPYRAETSAPTAGDWLETPRMFIPGYAATVNGHPAEVVPTPSGLVAIKLLAGENHVVLRYAGPWTLRASYWIALLTWGIALVLIVRRAALRWSGVPAA